MTQIFRIIKRDTDSVWFVCSCHFVKGEVIIGDFVFSSSSIADCYAYIKCVHENLIIN
jgi:hypothetical protein